MTIVTVSGDANGHLLPAGLLGVWARLLDADQSGRRRLDSGRHRYWVQIRSRRVIRHVHGPYGDEGGIDWLRGRSVIPVCGIARPDSFIRILKGVGAVVGTAIEARDHYNPPCRMLRRLNGRAPFVTTTKDAVRWPDEFRSFGLILG